MGDMTKTVVPKSDQMNAEDLLAGPRDFTIARVSVGDGDEQPVSVWFHEFSPRRPFKPSKTVRRLMIRAWGDESKVYVGHRMRLYTDPTVRFGGSEVGGIRVSHMSGIERQLRVALAETKGRRKAYVVDPMPDAPPPSPGHALAAALEAAGHRTPAQMLAYCRSVVDRPINRSQDLTPAEIEQVHEALVAATSSAPPTAVATSAASSNQGPGPVAPAPGEPSDAELEAAFEAEQERLRGEGRE